MRAEINWLEPRSRTQMRMVRMYHRLVNLPDSRLTKKIFLWDLKFSENNNFATWSKEIKDILKRNDFEGTFSANIFDLKSTINSLQSTLSQKDQIKRKNQCKNLPKLRTYNQITDYTVDKCYLSKPLSFLQRRYVAKLRLGVLPLRIETGRYERPKKLPAERLCTQCTMGTTEDEVHFLLHCPRHCLFRNLLFSKIENDNFFDLADIEKLKFLLNHPDIVKTTAQFIVNAFNNRVVD